MSSPCIHGFRSDECASCRTCPHGLVRMRCGRCESETATVARRRAITTTTEAHPSQEYSGFEIFYDPAVSGWLYRDADDAPSEVSYRSAFLARKAVDGLGGAPKPAPRRKRS